LRFRDCLCLFRGGVAVADSPVAVAAAAASVEKITAVAGAAVVSLYADPLEGAAVADAAAIALAAAAPVVGAAVAVAAALTIATAAAEGADVAQTAVEGPDPEALFLLLSQASHLSLLYCCLLALGGRFFDFLSAAVVSLHQKVTSSTPPLDSS
jgi:hypothetical protein